MWGTEIFHSRWHPGAGYFFCLPSCLFLQGLKVVFWVKWGHFFKKVKASSFLGDLIFRRNNQILLVLVLVVVVVVVVVVSTHLFHHHHYLSSSQEKRNKTGAHVPTLGAQNGAPLLSQEIPLSRWQRFLASLTLQKRVDFEEGDLGLAGASFSKGGGNSTHFWEFFTRKIGEDEPNLTVMFFKWVESTEFLRTIICFREVAAGFVQQSTNMRFASPLGTASGKRQAGFKEITSSGFGFMWLQHVFFLLGGRVKSYQYHPSPFFWWKNPRYLWMCHFLKNHKINVELHFLKCHAFPPGNSLTNNIIMEILSILKWKCVSNGGHP